MMILDTISDIKNTINKTFVYTDGENLGTTKHLLSSQCEFQEYHISNHTPTTAKSIKSNVRSQNLIHVHCEIERILTRVSKSIETETDIIVYADIDDYSEIRAMITYFINYNISTRLYVCYLVPDSKEPDYHIIHYIKQFMIEYGDKLKLVKFARYPKNIFTPYKLNTNDYVFSYLTDTKKNHMMFYALDINIVM